MAHIIRLTLLRYGIKPLFWTVADGRLLVAAEMKAFIPIDGVKFEWDVRSIIDGGVGFAFTTHFKGIEKVSQPLQITNSSLISQ